MSLQNAVVPVGQVQAPRRKCVFAPNKVNRQGKLSIPAPILWHMIKNPINHKVWDKLIQTCKYFFYYNKVIPIGYFLIDPDVCNMGKNFIKGDIRGIAVNLSEVSCKFWLNDYAYLEGCQGNSTLLLDRLYRCDIKVLQIPCPIPFNVFQKLTSSGTITTLELLADLKHSDGSLPSVEQYLAHLPNLEKIRWWFGNGNSDGNNSVKTPEDAQCFFEILSNLKNLDHLDLTNLPEECFPAFVDFVKKNKSVDIYFFLYVWEGVSEAYLNSIKEFAEETLENPLVKVPAILLDFEGDDEDEDEPPPAWLVNYNELAASTTKGKKIERYFFTEWNVE